MSTQVEPGKVTTDLNFKGMNMKELTASLDILQKSDMDIQEQIIVKEALSRLLKIIMSRGRDPPIYTATYDFEVNGITIEIYTSSVSIHTLDRLRRNGFAIFPINADSIKDGVLKITLCRYYKGGW